MVLLIFIYDCDETVIKKVPVSSLSIFKKSEINAHKDRNPYLVFIQELRYHCNNRIITNFDKFRK